MRKFWPAVVAVVLVAAAVVMVLQRRQVQWSTANPEALAFFRDGLAASMKYYRNDARRCFAKAVEADPSFTVAKAFLLNHLDPRSDAEGVAALIAELDGADLGPLTPRERFLVERAVATARRDLNKASALTEAFTARCPDDPFGLFHAGQDAVLGGDLRRARRAFERLLESDPNWVMAYNHLGYIAMAEGKLDDAERMFTTYRFIAPDQANPHDSLGELYLLTGRLDEAEREFELAIQARLDFRFSYENLVRVETLRGDESGVDAALFRARESGAVPPEPLARLECWARGWLAARTGDWSAVAQLAEQACSAKLPLDLGLRAALFTRRPELQAEVMERLAAHQEESGGPPASRLDLQATAAYLEGIQAAGAGELAKAAELFRAAAAGGSLWGFSRGFARLCAWSSEAKALERLGRGAEAARALMAMRAVNPSAQEMLGRATDLPVPSPTS